MDNQSLGQKIKNFRVRSKMSQLDLELEIDASPGSISRIESGKVNPTKETLSKIGKALNLNSSEIASLIGLYIFTPEQLVKAINQLSKSLDIDTVLQTAVDSMFNLYPNYNGGVIFLLDNKDPNKLFSKTVSRIKGMELIYPLLPKKIQELNVSLVKDLDNYVVQSINTNTIIQSFEVYNFIKGAVSQHVSEAITRILNHKVCICFPMGFDEEVIGAVIYTKRVREEFNAYEQNLLSLLTEQIAIAIKNAEKFNELQVNNGRSDTRTKN